jgi:hypothetical protein
MKKQINPTIKAHLIRGAFYLLLLLAVCAIPFVLARPMPGNQHYSSKAFSSVERPAGIPCTPGWSPGGNFPSAGVRSVGVYFPANGKFYAMGGRSADTAGSDFTHPFEYDPNTNTWTTKAATYADNQVNNMACGVLTDAGTPYIYCVGGSAAGGTTATDRVFRYNPVSDTISAVAGPWPGAMGTILPGGFSVFSNKLYILGGFNINVGMVATIYEFTPPTTWVLKTAVLPVPLGYIPTTTIGTLIYTGGGSTYDGLIHDTTNSFVYNPVADSISTIASIPRPTGETRALNFNNQMWVMGGGREAPNPSNEVDIYNPGPGTWSTGLPFTTARRNFATDTNGTDHIWLAGGYDSTGVPINTTEVFCLGGGTPTPTPTASPTPTCLPTYTTATTTGSITAGGTDIGNHCDDCTTQVNLPFPVNVYGAPNLVAFAGSNGTLQFVAVPQPKPFFFDQCIPVDPTQGGPFLNTLFPYYDDLRTDETGVCADCGIFTQTLGTAPNRQFVIRWKTTYFDHPGKGTAEFEVLLTEGSDTLSAIYGTTLDSGLEGASGIQKDLTVFTSFSCFEAVLTPGVRVNYIPTGCGSPTPTATATATATTTVTATPTATATVAPRATPTPRPRPTPAPRP